MHRKRLPGPFGTNPSIPSRPLETGNMLWVGFVCCPAVLSTCGWWQPIYQAAYEMALAANQPTPLERALAVSMN